MAKLARYGFFFVLILLVSGCATNRGYLDVRVPEGSLVNPNGKQVYIRSITDNRQFQDNPSSADIPSLGFGGLKEAAPDIKNRAIARKRNDFGKALGDILLEEGQSVQEIVRTATRSALYSLGYAVVDRQEDAQSDAIIMDISIDKFWGWLLPGFWTLALKSEITTVNTVSVPQKDKPIIVRAEAINRCQVGNTANWQKVFELVVKDFIEKAKMEFKNIDENK